MPVADEKPVGVEASRPNCTLFYAAELALLDRLPPNDEYAPSTPTMKAALF
jgi:hypothetical protein